MPDGGADKGSRPHIMHDSPLYQIADAYQNSCKSRIGMWRREGGRELGSEGVAGPLARPPVHTHARSLARTHARASLRPG